MKIYKLLPVAALVAAAFTAGPVFAEVDVHSDPRGDSRAGGLDLQRVRVANQRHLAITTTHRNLSAKSSGGVAVYIDTRPGVPGPEFLIAGGAGGETDWEVFPVRRWQTVEGALPCRSGRRADYRRETLTYSLGRSCLGSYRAVRVNVVASRYETSTEKFFYDYSPARRRLGPEVRRN